MVQCGGIWRRGCTCADIVHVENLAKLGCNRIHLEMGVVLYVLYGGGEQKWHGDDTKLGNPCEAKRLNICPAGLRGYLCPSATRIE